MYPDLSYFFHDIFGTPVDNFFSIFQTFGLFLTLAFLSSAYIFYLELRRKEKEGVLQGKEETETIGQAPSIVPIAINGAIGFLVGFKIVYAILNFGEFKADAAGTIVSSKGNLIAGIVGGIILGAMKYYEMNKAKLPEPKVIRKMVMPSQRIGDLTILAAISGIAGARLFSILENFGDFIQDPIGQLFSGSGLTIYGGLILAFAVVYFYVKRKGMTPIHIMDAVAPALIVGYAVGRLGCQFSGDGDWGIPNLAAKPSWFFLPDWAWAYDYPHNVINSAGSGGVPIPDCNGLVAVGGATPEHCTKLKEAVYPTPLWEAFFGLIIFVILWVLRKRLKIAGMLFFIYVIFNGIERFFIEGIRVNPRYDLLNMGWSLSQWIAIGLLLTGITGCALLIKFGKPIFKNSASA